MCVCVGGSADFQRFWCSLDRSLLLYETEHSVEPVLQINARDVVCVGVSRPHGAINSSNNNNNGFVDRLALRFCVWVLLTGSCGSVT